MKRNTRSVDLPPRPTRRTFLTGLGLAAGTALWPGRARADNASTKILVAGDSMIAGGFGLFLERALQRDHGYDVVRRGKTSSGLARPDFFDWMKEARELVEARQPDVSIVMFGGNDVQGLYMGRDAAKRRAWVTWHDEGWVAEYSRRVAEFCDILAPDDQRVYWIGLPIMRPDKFRSRCDRVNAIYRAQMAVRKNATFVDTWPVLADDEGNYADRIALQPASEGKKPKLVRVRAGDGIHLSPAGAHHLVAHVLSELAGSLPGLPADLSA
jgi:uncharacterized protein